MGRAAGRRRRYANQRREPVRARVLGPHESPPRVNHAENRLTLLRRYAVLDADGKIVRCHRRGDCAGKVLFPDEKRAVAAIAAMRVIASGGSPTLAQRVYLCEHGRGAHVTSKPHWVPDEEWKRARRKHRRQDTLAGEDAGESD